MAFVNAYKELSEQTGCGIFLNHHELIHDGRKKPVSAYPERGPSPDFGSRPHQIFRLKHKTEKWCLTSIPLFTLIKKIKFTEDKAFGGSPRFITSFTLEGRDEIEYEFWIRVMRDVQVVRRWDCERIDLNNNNNNKKLKDWIKRDKQNKQDKKDEDGTVTTEQIREWKYELDKLSKRFSHKLIDEDTVG